MDWRRAGAAGPLFLVAEAPNGQVMGYVGCQYVLDEGYITNVAVFPNIADRERPRLCWRPWSRKAGDWVCPSFPWRCGRAMLPLKICMKNQAIARRDGEKIFIPTHGRDGLILTKRFKQEKVR